MIDAYEKLAAQLNETQLTRNEQLAPYTTFRIGGPAEAQRQAPRDSHVYTSDAADDS